MILLLDNFDSFTYNLVDYLQQLGQECMIVRNDQSPESLRDIPFKGLLLSPGPGKPLEAGFLMDYIRFFETKLPILGVCLGHQALGQYYGASLVKARKPMHGKLSQVKQIAQSEFCRQLPDSWEVVRYHSLIVQNFEGTALTPILETHSNENMGFQHKFLPIYGIQFHPEAVLTQFGMELLNNWLTIIQNKQTAIIK